MSLLLLVDGYNLSQPIAPSRSPDPRWLQKNRNVLLRDLANHLTESVRKKTCVVFDAANPPRNRPTRFSHQEMDVRFAVGYPSADDLLEELIRGHHTPKRLMVVSSDHRVQTAARRRGARFYDSQPWIDDLTDGKVHLAVKPPKDPGGAGQGGPANPDPSATATHPIAPESRKPRVEDPSEVSQWMREFGFDED